MALNRQEDLGLNGIYAEMMKKQAQQLKEGVTSSNSVHGDIEAYSKEFAAGLTSSIDGDAVEAKLKNLESGVELTGADKKIIASIRKLATATNGAIEAFRKAQEGIKYDFIVSKKAGSATSEEALEGADHGEEAVAADEVAEPVEPEAV